MSEHDGGPAYPAWSTEEPFFIQGGMTLRDYFAAHATESDISALVFSRELEAMSPEEYIAARCAARYQHADAMLRERERKPS